MTHAYGDGWIGSREVTGVRSATIISDIHGMLPALEAVLEDEASDPSEALVVLGDTTAGPMPNETIALLRRHEDRLIAISGNADRNVVEFHDGRLADPATDLTKHEASIVNDQSLNWIRALPATAIVGIGSLGPVFCCHAVPGNDMDVVLVDTRIARWQEIFAEVPETCRTVLLGHTHMPFQRLAAGKRVINPGSVGLPFGEPGAHWLRIVDGMVEQRVTTFDHEAARETIRAVSTFPGFDEWIGDYLGEPPDDVYVSNLFGARDGRPSPTPAEEDDLLLAIPYH